MIRAIIVEDEFHQRETLIQKLKEYTPDVTVVAACDCAETALVEIIRLQPQLIFLDIQLPEKNGLWLADSLLQMNCETFTPPEVIFTTAYSDSEYLLKAFELAAIDYLIKPVGIENLKKAVARYRERASTTTGLQNLTIAIHEEKLLKFKSLKGLFVLRPEDIAYIEADRDYAMMFFSNGTEEEVFERLGEIEKKLPQDIFLRVGKSVIVNRKYIRKITDSAFQLVTPAANYTVEISREAIRQLKEKLI